MDAFGGEVAIVNLLRGFLAALLLVVASSSWAQECAGIYTTNAAAKAACQAARQPQGYSNCNSLIRYAPGVCGADYHWYMPYGGPELQFGFLVAAGTCPAGYTVSGSTCVPPAPPSCADMQTYIDGVCTPDTPQPEVDAPAPDAGIEVGTYDEAGNIVTTTAAYDTLMSGGSVSYNCGGWECVVSVGDFQSDPGCVGPESGGVSSCSFTPRYTGVAASAGSSLPASVSTIGGSNVATPTAGCPAGYTLDANGVCTGTATPGTASTSTTPGTAATAAPTTCPTGYTADANGVCQGTAAPSITSGGQTACPNGYTADALGHCTATATLNSPAPEAGSCGAPGYPACPAIDTTTAMENVVTGYADKSTWFSWVWTPPVGECSAFEGTVHGYAVSWNLCPTINNIRDVIGWLFGLFGCITIYGQIFRGHA